jgi:hypothetical protein
LVAFAIGPTAFADAGALCALRNAAEEIEAWLRRRDSQAFRDAMTKRPCADPLPGCARQ